VTEATTTTYALLALLRLRSWTSYELTQQARRNLRVMWPRSEANLYIEQKRLLRLGWARARTELVGRRRRTRYDITPAGKRALRAWLATDPSEPRFEVEGILRLFFAEYGSLDDLRRSLEATAAHARATLDDGLQYVREYLGDGGPFPERQNLIGLAATWIVDSLGLLESFCIRAADLISSWDTAAGPADPDFARTLFAQIVERHTRPPLPSTDSSSEPTSPGRARTDAGDGRRTKRAGRVSQSRGVSAR
jgi:DNA-binding PadR family transcriptional regulator